MGRDQPISRKRNWTLLNREQKQLPSEATLLPSPSIVEGHRSDTPKLGWNLVELASSLTVSVPFLRLEITRGRLRCAHFGRRVVVLDAEVNRYLAQSTRTRSR
jgi:hypothetical protein